MNDIFAWAEKAHQLQTRLSLNTRILTPSNYLSEQERFFSSERYNPQFKYAIPTISNVSRHIYSLHESLDRLSLPAELAAYGKKFVHNLMLVNRTRNAIGTDRFAALAGKLYGYRFESAEHVRRLLPPVKFADTKNAPVYDAESMRSLFQTYINDHPHIADAEVTIDHYNNHTIRVGDTKLTIGSAVKRNRKNVERLIVHEIESHMLQRQNLKHLQNPLLLLRQPHERELYAEGMAVYNEVISGTITKRAFDMYFLRLKAVELSKYSFRDIFQYLSPLVQKQTAFVITYRVKRGLANTKRTGGFPKDAAYLLGYAEILDYLKRGGKREMLYISPSPELGQMLLKYNLLPTHGHFTPRFWESST